MTTSTTNLPNNKLGSYVVSGAALQKNVVLEKEARKFGKDGRMLSFTDSTTNETDDNGELIQVVDEEKAALTQEEINERNFKPA